ncbi:MAG: P-type conjugative transfer protein TrbL, partial [Acidaminococcaceae bacterium]|nr:P-type conjugative transfer protein TrbL [Acidaminococcaceae bacterium]
MRLVLLILPLALLIPDTVFAADGTLVSEIVNEFHKNLSKYEQVMLKYAKILFYWCAVLEVAWLGIKASLGTAQIKESIKDFCMVLLAAGFFLAVINNYHTWTWNIINGLKAIAGEATSLYDAADKPFTVGLELAKTVFAKTSYTSPFDSITYVLAGMAILICFALITMQVILIKCECIVAVCAAAILLGLGASAFFRDYAINTIKFIVSVAFKLMTMYLLLGVGIGFLSQLQIADNNWLQIGVTISFCIIFYCLVQTLPQTVAGILTGSHSGDGGGGFDLGLPRVAPGAG